MKFNDFDWETNLGYCRDNGVVFLLKDSKGKNHTVSHNSYLGGVCDCRPKIYPDEMIVVVAYMVRDGKLIEIEVDDLIKLGGEK